MDVACAAGGWHAFRVVRRAVDSLVGRWKDEQGVVAEYETQAALRIGYAFNSLSAIS